MHVTAIQSYENYYRKTFYTANSEIGHKRNC